MADKTPFAGLTHLEPSDSLAEDNFGFQDRNPLITDQLLRIGARDHRHDAHAALANPTLDPLLAVLDTGGTIGADLAIHVGYTLLDAGGGETALNTNQLIASTRAGLSDPTGAPGLAAAHTVGTLLAGTYGYAVTVTDGAGGETALGPSQEITIDPGFANSEITLNGLTAIITAAGGTGWRLWRSVNGGDFNLVATGAGDGITDDGSLVVDCNVAPPSTTTGNTNGTSRLHVTVPGGQPAAAVSFRIYASLDGNFGSPALLGTYPIADAGSVKEYTTFAPTTGAPPASSLAIGGANKIDPDLELIDWHWKRPVADAAALAAVTSPENGDVRVTLDTKTFNVYGAGTWTALGSLTPGHVVQEEGADLPTQPRLDFIGANVTATDDATNHKTLVTVTQALPEARTALNASGGAAPAFAANWANHAAGLGPVLSFWRDSDGRVELEGVAIKTGSAPAAGDVMFTLPAGYRPTEVTPLATVGGDDVTAHAFAAVRIQTNGDVVWEAGQAGANPWISLNGLGFRP